MRLFSQTFRRSCLLGSVVLLGTIASTGASAAEESVPPMKTRWAAQVSPDNVLPEYPRPHLVRGEWTNLNGLWDIAILPGDASAPKEFGKQILVPFAVESYLSRVQRPVTPEQAVWYRRSFQAEKPRSGGRLLLHFGAVDWSATVWVNGSKVGSHQGGFDPFSFDITDHLLAGREQVIQVRVTDPSDRGVQPRGKQTLEPGLIVYTAVTGIWQTVWLEQVPETYIAELIVTGDVDAECVEIAAQVVGPNADNAIVRAKVPREGGAPLRATGKANEVIRISLPDAQLWSPDSPHLYDLEVDIALLEEDLTRNVADSVTSYFGLRKIELKEDQHGHTRIFLNGSAVFQLGPLDQGYWPDGLYTAPTDQALRYDIEVAKRCGFNICRKHAKVEPERWYYWCDRLGMLVWQDFPNSDRGISRSDVDLDRTPESEAIFRQELEAMVQALWEHPCIVVWVPFNEGWGQFKTNEIIEWLMYYDPTRLVDGPSGYCDRGVGDMVDIHSYPGPSMSSMAPGRASVLGEFGGQGHAVEGHLWDEPQSWGYEYIDEVEGFQEDYGLLLTTLWLLKQQGLSAAIYTQLTDVEGEVNGLMTYDREVLKVDSQQASQWNRRLYGPDPAPTILVPCSRDENGSGEVWQFATETPANNWADPAFDDSHWRRSRGGFGTPNTPGAVVRTEWNSPEIWLRRQFTFAGSDLRDHQLFLMVHHDEDAEVFINGVRVAELPRHTTDYRIAPMAPQALSALREGENLLAVHCRQTRGGQYIDLGLLTIGAGGLADAALTDGLDSAPSVAHREKIP